MIYRLRKLVSISYKFPMHRVEKQFLIWSKSIHWKRRNRQKGAQSHCNTFHCIPVSLQVWELLGTITHQRPHLDVSNTDDPCATRVRGADLLHRPKFTYNFWLPKNLTVVVPHCLGGFVLVQVQVLQSKSVCAASPPQPLILSCGLVVRGRPSSRMRSPGVQRTGCIFIGKKSSCKWTHVV